jgi:chemotaxis protein histidine kinase CheA
LQEQPTPEEIEMSYRTMHSIKGNAGLLNLAHLSSRAHEFEEILKDTKRNDHTLYLDHANLTRILHELEEIMGEIRALVDRITSFYEKYNARSTSSGGLLIKAVENLIQRFQNELKRDIALELSGFNVDLVTAREFLIMKDIFIQLTHNAIAHGLQSPEKRKQLKKNPSPQISLRLHHNNNNIQFHFKDDGCGLDIDKLRVKALASGKWKKDEIEKWNDREVVQVIFTPGISTAEKTSLISGRGIGMDLVRQKVDRLKGKIEVHSETGMFCEFIITIPASIN